MMPKKTLLVLAGVSFDLGLIGEDEYMERVSVAMWLGEEDSVADPRSAGQNIEELRAEIDIQSENSEVTLKGTKGPSLERPDWIHLVVFSKWYFTRSDADPYPSTPHGHLHNANRAWPKLNPYTGRVFKAKHQEDCSLRLNKKQMRELWRTEAFRDFCRSHILWYMEAHPHHRFGVRHLLRFPYW